MIGGMLAVVRLKSRFAEGCRCFRGNATTEQKGASLGMLLSGRLSLLLKFQ